MRPLEASGTSGMKAALNGVPSLSVLDGWWIEGCLEGTTGWAIGGGPATLPRWIRTADVAASCTTSSSASCCRCTTACRTGGPRCMRNAIALNGSFFNTQRMVMQYVHNAYAPRSGAEALLSMPTGRT